MLLVEFPSEAHGLTTIRLIIYSISKSIRLETQEDPLFQFYSEGKKKLVSQFKVYQAGINLSYLAEGQTLFYSDLQMIGMRPTHLREDNLVYSVYL